MSIIFDSGWLLGSGFKFPYIYTGINDYGADITLTNEHLNIDDAARALQDAWANFDTVPLYNGGDFVANVKICDLSLIAKMDVIYITAKIRPLRELE